MCVKSDAPAAPEMLLREVHFPAGPFRRPPYLHPPLQRPHLPVLKRTRILPLQALKHRLGLQPGVLFKQLLNSSHTSPNGSGRSATHAPPATRSATGSSRRYFRAVFGSIPAFDAAIS